MPRGARGASYRGGSRSKPGTARIGGVEIRYDNELEEHLRDRPQPTPLFPPRDDNPKMRPLSSTERDQIAKFRELRERIHEGPLYAVPDENARVGKSGKRIKRNLDPFEGVQTYSQRYTRKRRQIPRLNTRSYLLQYFPAELHAALEPPRRRANDEEAGAEKKLENSKDLLETVDDDDEPAEQLDDEDQPLESERDSEYASDEDEMAGDYNAEQYFDDGGDDAGDDYDAGEAEGGEY